MNEISIFGHMNYLLTLFSYSVKDMLRLRILAIVAGSCGIVYSLFFADFILWVEFSWESAFITVNLYHIAMLLRERGNFFLNDEEAALYTMTFPHMKKYDFRKLLTAGGWRSYDTDDIIISEGSRVGVILVIGTGSADILAEKKRVASCSSGALLGEMSYITGESASATVRAAGPTRCFVWEQEALRKITEKNEPLKQGLQSALNENFIMKLKKHRDMELSAKKNKKRG
jgi:hypothetical protein